MTERSARASARAVAALVLAALLLVGTGRQALASRSTVQVTVRSGSFDAQVTVALPAISPADRGRTLEVPGALEVDDLTGTGAGWSVALRRGQGGLTLVSAGDPVVLGGEGIDPQAGPRVDSASDGGLVFGASRGHGQGHYRVPLRFSYQVPAGASATPGATIVTTLATGP